MALREPSVVRLGATGHSVRKGREGGLREEGRWVGVVEKSRAVIVG